jgi:hypothetical protein
MPSTTRSRRPRPPSRAAEFFKVHRRRPYFRYHPGVRLLLPFAILLASAGCDGNSAASQSLIVQGEVTGLAPGNALVLQNNQQDNLLVGSDGPFRFSTALAAGSSFRVTVLLQPVRPAQSCTVSGGDGTVGSGEERTVYVSCQLDTYAVGGTISGLAPGNSLVIDNDGADAMTLDRNGTFVFPARMIEGATYAVAVRVPPTSPDQACLVENGRGTVLGADVTDVTITCEPLGYAAVSGGTFHFCALRADGILYCQGNNDWYGETYPPPGSDFVGVAGGFRFSCAVRLDGTVTCWGNNNSGQSNTPSSGFFTAVAAGDEHACALRSNGGLTCWGNNAYGQTTAPTGTGFLAVDVGYAHGCAIRGDHSVTCWGRNDHGQTNAPAGSNFVALASGYIHNCALRTDGSVTCWGDNDSGELDVPPGLHFMALAAGSWNTCGVVDDGSLACWGYDVGGASTPPTTGDYFAVGSGQYYGCAIGNDGTLHTWGDI